MYHIPSFSFKGNHSILQFTHNWLRLSLSKVSFSMFVIALLWRNLREKFFWLKQLSTCTTNIKMSYMHCKLEFGIRVWIFEGISKPFWWFLAYFTLEKHWFWLFPYYADNQITIKVKKITNFDLGKEERRREKKFSNQRQLLFTLKTEKHIIFYNIF